MIKNCFALLLASVLFVSVYAQPGWPPVKAQNRPWTRWWWLGSAVDEKGLTANLEQLHAAGFGGVEITPIYGVKGFEKQHLSFLSPQWMRMFDHTLSESNRLGMGVDLANATGWPFGGPWVKDEDASRSLYLKTYQLNEGETLKEKVEYVRSALVRTANTKKPDIQSIQLPFAGNPLMQEMALDQVQFPGPLKLEALIAQGPDGQHADITSFVASDGSLRWTPTKGQWQLNALFSGLHGKMVERAAPGGEGYAIDHFSNRAITRYLQHFDSAFNGKKLDALRGFFNDSYEVDDAQGQANWTPRMFEYFKASRGYDLRNFLPALVGQSTLEMNSKVRFDYRSVVDELILKNFTEEWKKWGHRQGKILRNQSHGSPANTLDLYSVVDIPETEGVDWLRFKFAASAAHVSGKPLVAAEAATWLNEHFLSSWGDVKKALDLYFLAGINHLVYHGNAYSPLDAPWPGWNFYAAVHFQPTHPQWSHLSTLNTYVTRVQSFLQQGKPKHDVLLYYPIADRYAAADGPLLQHFDGMERNFEHTDFEKISKSLQAKGIGFDFISDRQLTNVKYADRHLQVNGMKYKLILVPEMQHLDLPALKELDRLAKAGATIAFHGAIPSKLPGLYRLDERMKSRQSILSALSWTTSNAMRVAKKGAGTWIETKDLEGLLSFMNIIVSPFEKSGMQSHVRQTDSNSIVFVTNRADNDVDAWVPLPSSKKLPRLFDPMTGEITHPSARKSDKGELEIRLKLQAYASVLLVWDNSKTKSNPHFYADHPVSSLSLDNDWKLVFKDGGPVLPSKQSLPTVSYWTDLKDSVFQSFSGRAVYHKNFSTENPDSLHWQLDLGEVQSSARVKLNGVDIGVTLGPIHRLEVPKGLLKKENHLEVGVANLMANRISYMDRNQQPWKIFYNINTSAKRKENLKNGIFDSSHWLSLSSGLKGPVQLKAYTL